MNGLHDSRAYLGHQQEMQKSPDPGLRESLAECINELRSIAFGQLTADPPKGACADQIEELEKIASEDAKRLAAERNRVAEDLKSTDADHDALSSELLAIKESLTELESIVAVTGTTVAETKNAYTEARDTALQESKDAKQAKACVDRWAYVTLKTDADHKPLLNCVRLLQGKIQKGTPEEIRAAEKEFNLPLSRLEQRLRGVARERVTKLKQTEAKRDAATGTEKTNLSKEVEELEAQIKDIRTAVIIPNETLAPEFSDYEQYFNKFFIGIEYVSIDDAFGKGFMRVGLMTGFHYPRQKVPSITGRNWYPGTLGVYQTFTAALTNTAESTLGMTQPVPTASVLPAEWQAGPDDPVPPPADPEPEADPDPERALELEAQLFMPLWRSDYHPEHPRLRNHVGPIVAFGGKFADNDEFATHRIYGGLRMAGSHEQYVDILYGRTFNLRSRRLEFRGQYPVLRLGNNTRIILGAIGNFGVSDEKKTILVCNPPEEPCQEMRAVERDRLRIYLTWDVPITSIFGAFGAGK